MNREGLTRYCCVTIPICPRAPTAWKGRSVPGPTG